MRLRVIGLVVGLAGACGAGLAQQQVWTVRPEWVRAHEDFLASDALMGRGSATRDERIAAEYVASEFLAYGLRMAPGLVGFVQAADVVSPVLDHVRLSAGNEKFEEGKDFELLVSTGKGASGALVHVADGGVDKIGVAQGVAIVLTDVPAGGGSMKHFAALRRLNPSLLLVQQDASTEERLTMFGGKTRLPVQLRENVRPTTGVTVVALHAAAMARVKALGDGVPVFLALEDISSSMEQKTYNAIGYLPGSDANAGTILLTAHLDHLGVGKPVNGDGIFNGANDDAAGTTAVIELAHALAAGPKLRRSVLFVCYGSEEAGELGSTYFGEHPPVPLASLVANLEFEMIGNQDPKMPKGVLLLTGWERSNLGPALKEHGALVGPDPYPEQHFFERSDNYALALKGVVAQTAAGWGTPPTYHQQTDDVAHLDLGFMTSAIQSLVEPVRWLAMSDFKPEWAKDGQPKRAAR